MLKLLVAGPRDVLVFAALRSHAARPEGAWSVVAILVLRMAPVRIHTGGVFQRVASVDAKRRSTV